jgi:hypothetical protein
VPDTPPSPIDVAALLERLRLRPQDVSTAAAASRAHIELILARITALTELLERDGVSHDTRRVATRLLLADLGVVSAWFRAQANEAASALSRVLDGARQTR